MDKCLITACSNKYYPSVLNLIGSLKANYPDHPRLFVYDLGLAPIFKKQLSAINGVEILPPPNFCSFWRSGYAWKTYILSTPLADLNFYLDAGGQVEAPLTEIFERIEADDYFAFSVDPTLPLEKITPAEFKFLFPGAEKFSQAPCLAAGIFGFKRASRVSNVLEALRAAAAAGLTLGFSEAEQWRNKGRDKSPFIRNCPIFRHDQTILNLLLRQHLGDLKLHTQASPEPIKADPNFKYETSLIYWPQPVITILGRGYKKLGYAALAFPKNKTGLNALLNLFLFLKAARLKVKKFLNLTRS